MDAVCAALGVATLLEGQTMSELWKVKFSDSFKGFYRSVAAFIKTIVSMTTIKLDHKVSIASFESSYAISTLNFISNTRVNR